MSTRQSKAHRTTSTQRRRSPHSTTPERAAQHDRRTLHGGSLKHPIEAPLRQQSRRDSMSKSRHSLTRQTHDPSPPQPLLQTLRPLRLSHRTWTWMRSCGATHPHPWIRHGSATAKRHSVSTVLGHSAKHSHLPCWQLPAGQTSWLAPQVHCLWQRWHPRCGNCSRFQPYSRRKTHGRSTTAGNR